MYKSAFTKKYLYDQIQLEGFNVHYDSHSVTASYQLQNIKMSFAKPCPFVMVQQAVRVSMEPTL